MGRSGKRSIARVCHRKRPGHDLQDKGEFVLQGKSTRSYHPSSTSRLVMAQHPLSHRDPGDP